MAQFAICNLLFGAVFGLRFKVLILLPLTLISAGLTIVSAVVAQQALLPAIENLTICTFALHGGYLLGSAARFTMAAARLSKPLPRKFTGARQFHT